MYDEVVAKLEMETKEPAKDIETYLHFTIFNNIQALLPIVLNTENFQLTPETLIGLIGNFNVNRQFFINTGRITHAYATEVGIPAMVQYSEPKFFSIVAKSETQTSGNKISSNVEITIRIDRVTQSTSRTLTPWTGTAMVAGVDNRQVLVL
ncbi:unnamed protein product, partial [Meganyctiphanes norvegica]